MDLHQEIQLRIPGITDSGGEPETAAPAPRLKRHSIRWWASVAVDMAMVLGGQSVTVLLGRLYFNSGGSNMWLFTLAHSAGAPLLAAPLLLTPRAAAGDGEPRPAASNSKTAAVCAGLGAVIALDNLMYAYAVLYLPVSTFSLLAATQLAFSAVASRLVNARRLTPLTLNSVVVLTFSAALLGVGASDDRTSTSHVPRGKYAAGFVLTLSAAAVYALTSSLFEAAFDRVIRARTPRWALRMQVYTNVAASAVCVAALLATGQWRTVHAEMAAFRGGRARYAATLVGIAVAWQAATLGMVRLVTRASSLFAVVTSTLGLPLVPVLAVPLFGDTMTGVKVVAMLMAVWGFLSYVYQDYLDDTA